MNGSFIWLLVSLPAMILQWTGVVVLARAGRRADWWCMLAGVILSTASPLLFAASALGIGLGSGGAASRAILGFFSLVSLIGMAGSLLFMTGFCLHAFRAVRLMERSAELEAIASAQAEEMNRMGGRG